MNLVDSDEVPWCILFTNDIILVDETKETISFKLERWREILESKYLRTYIRKTEYMKCNFSKMVKKMSI